MQHNNEIPQNNPRQNFEKQLKGNIELLSFNDYKEALGTIAWLLHFDERFKNQPYSKVINDIYGSVLHNQYVIAAEPMGESKTLFPVAVLCWGMFNTPVATLRANNIRPLSPSEYNCGDIGFFTIFSSPFEQPDVMMELLRSKSQKLQSLGNLTFVDKLFKPDYT
jgi:hemolysin-activating ACP:hemolysin acyltransferase